MALYKCVGGGGEVHFLLCDEDRINIFILIVCHIVAGGAYQENQMCYEDLQGLVGG